MEEVFSYDEYVEIMRASVPAKDFAQFGMSRERFEEVANTVQADFDALPF